MVRLKQSVRALGSKAPGNSETHWGSFMPQLLTPNVRALIIRIRFGLVHSIIIVRNSTVTLRQQSHKPFPSRGSGLWFESQRWPKAVNAEHTVQLNKERNTRLHVAFLATIMAVIAVASSLADAIAAVNTRKP